MAATTILRLISAVCLLTIATSDDLQTLLSLKTAFEHNTAFDSWNDNTPLCSFKGITCDSNGFIREIELSNQNLTGSSLPLTSLCGLKSLEKLSLGSNDIRGTVSSDLNRCVNLKYLDLGHNSFTGPFPDISNLNELVTLHANNSGFSGNFPWDSLKNMSNLRVLSLGDNPFDAARFPTVILNLTKLNWLYLSNCSIEGAIPEDIGNLVDLIELELSLNRLTGEIPRGLTRLTRLWQLELYTNDLIGELPRGFGNLSSLEFLDASNNSLHGNLSEIRFLNKLKSLQLYKNRFSGEVPQELGQFKNLVNLSLYMNELTGPLPGELGSWADFNFIDVSENHLSGPIPPNMCKNGAMKKLLMLQNNFTGEIPQSYADCATLIRFRVNKNALSGKVPSGIWGLPNAQIIDIADNNFEGNITSDIAKARSLAQLFLGNNKLSGELPREVSQASSLAYIDLSYNQFDGELPESIGDLKQLISLQLQGNRFSGHIPDSLGSCGSLNDVNMASNDFSGAIPSSLGSLQALNFLNLSRNHLSGEIPGTLSSLRLNLLDLSNNHLTGSIPESLLSEAHNGSFSGNIGLCSEGIRGFPQCSKNRSMPHRTSMIFLLLAAVFLTILISISVFCYLKKKRDECISERSLKNESWDVKSFHRLTFTEDEILDSIKRENLIGKGSSSNVYRVTLTNNVELAVKHIWHASDQYSSDKKKFASSSPMLYRRGNRSKEFEAEVRTLSTIRHINIVKLYCSISSEDSSLLVYEYMRNGSLWDRLHTCKKLALDWETRYEIALGSAKGLEYLHHGCDKPVIHRDVKSSNILLDGEFRPRIADFGLAKIVQTDSSKGSTQIIAGTHGYIAPEYAYTYKVNEKSDLYSFGVVLMELVTGKRPIEPEFGANNDIVSWVCSKLKTKEDVISIVDSEIPEFYRGNAIEVLKVAIRCTARLPSLRPTMRSVVQMLEEAKPRCQVLSVVVTKHGNE